MKLSTLVTYSPSSAVQTTRLEAEVMPKKVGYWLYNSMDHIALVVRIALTDVRVRTK